MFRFIHTLALILCMLAGFCYLPAVAFGKSSKGAAVGESLRNSFPGMERDEALYLLRLNHCEVTVVVDGSVPLLVLVKGESQEQAMQTAKQFAAIIDPKCTVTPFVGDEPAASIFTPFIDALDSYLFSPMHMILTPFDECHKLTRFVSWKEGVLTALVKDRGGRRKGEMEVTVIPRQRHMTFAKVKKVRGNLTYSEFVYPTDKRRARMWGFAGTRQLTPQRIRDMKKDFKCKEVVAFFDNRRGDQTCILDYGKHAYVGDPDSILETIRSEVTPPRPHFPENDLPWPAEHPSTSPAKP